MSGPHIEKAKFRIYLMVDSGTQTIMTRDLHLTIQEYYKIADLIRHKGDPDLFTIGMNMLEQIEKFKFELHQKRGLNRS